MLLKVSDLSVVFHLEDSSVKVLDKVSFTVGSKQTVALVGESGSGKSVSAMSVLRLLESIASVETRGSILFEGREILSLAEGEVRKIRGNRISMIFQEPMTSLNPVYPISNQIIEPLILHQQLSAKEALVEAVSLLDKCGIVEPDNKIRCYPHQLSGGQRQRVMIAMALACRPSLLIADEPTTALDVTIQAQILQLVQDLQEEFQMAVLLITHDLGMVRKIADYVYIMNDGGIVEHGATEKIYSRPQNPYTIHLLNSVPQGSPVPKKESTPLIRINSLSCAFNMKAGFFGKAENTVTAVDNVSLEIQEGKTYGVVGESGSGKSTLALSILRLVESKGEISYKNTVLSELSEKRIRPLRRDLQIVFQDPFSSLSPRLTVGQIITEGLTVHFPTLTKEESRQRLNTILAEVGLDVEMANRYPHEFSGGQRQRIAIARAMILEPKFIVLDEPTSALDVTIQAQIIDLLRKFQNKHKITYLFISHDLKVVRAIADEIAVMKDGQIVESGSASEIFSAPSHPYTKKLFSAAFDLTLP